MTPQSTTFTLRDAAASSITALADATPHAGDTIVEFAEWAQWADEAPDKAKDRAKYIRPCCALDLD